jgi:hypothetical protein
VTSAKLIDVLEIGSTSRIAASIRELRQLGIVISTEGARKATVFAWSEGWRTIIDPAEAKGLAVVARQPTMRNHVRIGRLSVKRKRKPPQVEVPTEREPEPEQHRAKPITLPVLTGSMNPNAGL